LAVGPPAKKEVGLHDELVYMNLHASVREKDDVSIIELSGDIDLFTFPLFKEVLFEVIDSGKKDLIVDLNSVDFIDSTGLAVLVGALKEVRGIGGTLGLICGKEAVVKVLEASGLNRIFHIYEHHVDYPGDNRTSFLKDSHDE